jgi:hypothetical protein
MSASDTAHWTKLSPSQWAGLLDYVYRIGAGRIPHSATRFIVYGVDRSSDVVVSYAPLWDGGSADAYLTSGWVFAEYVGDYGVVWEDHVMLSQQEAS